MRHVLTGKLLAALMVWFFVLTAWAEQKIWAWDKNVPEKEYCVSGYFEKTGENATTVYGYCVCFQGFWGPQCQFIAE